MKYNYIIYRLVFPNNKIYIGQTNNFINRKSQHKTHSYNKNRSEYNTKIGRAIRKYGWKNIIKEIICTVSVDFVDESEKYFIIKYNSMNIKFGYNLESGGNKNKDGYWKGKKRPDVSKKMSGKDSPNYGRKSPMAKPVIVYDKNGKYIKTFDSVTQSSIELKIWRANIFAVLSNKRKTAKGLIFKYV